MSMTNQQVIDDAFFDIKIIESGDSASATFSADGMKKLNQMMAAWKESDKDLQFFPQDTLGDTCPIPIWAEQAVIKNLAIKLAPAYSAPVTQLMVKEANDGESLVARTIINNQLEGSDLSTMPQGSGVNNNNILTDT